MNIKTRIICTIGPATENAENLEHLITSGMDIARFNFSHCSYEQFERIKKLIETFSAKHKRHVKILMDLQGPRMRVGLLPGGGLKLEEGKEVLFSTNESNIHAIHIKDPYLHLNIEAGHPIYLANGDMELMVIEKNDTEIKTRVIKGGILYSKKGINVPETDLQTDGLTDKDIKDIEFGIKNNVDYIALSFVKDSKDIEQAKNFLNGSGAQIIGKIERKQAILNLNDIIKAADLVMVARGDLGIEMPLEELPILQKKIIQKSKEFGKPSIVATQMLISMVNHHRPTGAEVTDVANAVLDGAWGLMLSDETAFGKYPIEALRYLVKTIQKAEDYKSEEAKN